MVNLSVIIITLNEEKNISRCIESVKKVADEIIVIDSFSTDRTREICSSFKNLKFVERKWEGYGKAKNFGASIAKNDIVLSLDADEALSEELINSIECTQLKVDSCYSFNRLTNYCGTWIRHGNWYPDKKIRIYPRDLARWTEDKVHEKLDMGTLKEVFIKGDLLHYSINSIKEHVDAINKYSDLAAQQAVLTNKRLYTSQIVLKPFFNFFNSYFLKRGFMDGYNGFLVSVISAHGKFLKYIKTREMKIKMRGIK